MSTYEYKGKREFKQSETQSYQYCYLALGEKKQKKQCFKLSITENKVHVNWLVQLLTESYLS